jgi:hypothetical protein
MSLIRSYQNGFEYTDLTESLLIIPNVWGLSQQLGIFSSRGTSQETITLEEITKSFGLMADTQRGSRHQVSKDYTRKMHSFAIPHFTLDDAITPRDIQGKRAYGAETIETLDAVRARKLERIRASHAATIETARMHTIVTGQAYAPNGTVTYDWYSEFGKTRSVISFALTDATTDVIGKVEEVFASMQDNALMGEIVGDIYAIASPAFFSALIGHPTMKEAFKYYMSQPQILRNRLQANGYDARYREFTFGNITFIEYRGIDVNGNPYVPAGDVYFLPSNSNDSFATYFAPAGKFGMENTVGEESYAFEFADPRGEEIILESETNFLSVLRRPQLIIRGTVA